MTARFLKTDGDGLLAEVDLGVYPLLPLLKTAYRFTDRCYLHLQLKSAAVVEVRFIAKEASSTLDSVAGEFCNELLDQTLRESVARESEAERNLILAHALSRTSLLHPELDAAAPFHDPEHIADSDKR